MILKLDIERLRTIDEVRDFMAGSEPVDFHLTERRGAYEFVTRALRRLSYGALTKADKGVVRRFVAKDDWPALCRRVDEVLGGQLQLAPQCPPALETHAQHIAAQFLARHRDLSATAGPSQRPDVQQLDVDSLELIRPRSVGVEHVGLWAMDQLGLRTRLQELGIGASLRAAAIVSIIARIARPGSERAARRWLAERSALGELLATSRPWSRCSSIAPPMR